MNWTQPNSFLQYCYLASTCMWTKLFTQLTAISFTLYIYPNFFFIKYIMNLIKCIIKNTTYTCTCINLWNFITREHKKTLYVVERGILDSGKGGYVFRTEKFVCHQVIVACVIMHNICKARQFPFPDGHDNDWKMYTDRRTTNCRERPYLSLKRSIPTAWLVSTVRPFKTKQKIYKILN